MSCSGRWIGSKFVKKNPDKSGKNFKCKVNAAKLREKKIMQHGITGLQAHNDAKRARTQEKRETEIDALRAASAAKRVRDLEDETKTLNNKLQELQEENVMQLKLRKEVELELQELKVTCDQQRQERDALWALVRKLKQENKILKTAQLEKDGERSSRSLLP